MRCHPLLILLVAPLWACDPRIDRDNPFDPQAPADRQRSAEVRGSVWVELEDGPGPGDVRVETIADDGRLDRATVAEDGGFVFERAAGDYTVIMRADGYQPERFGLTLAIGDGVVLERRILVDAAPPVAPVLRVPAAPGPVAERRIAVEVDPHPEPGVRIEFGGDIEPAPAVEGSVMLTEGDGLKRIEAVAVDRSGARSAVVSTTIALDTTAPDTGARLSVAGGAPEVRDREVDVRVLDAPADVVAVGLQAVVGDVCAADACPAVPCDQPYAAALRVTLEPTVGPQCVCGTVCDRAGNAMPVSPDDVTLGPYLPRPTPILDRLEPDELRAQPGAAIITVHGDAIAHDTVIDIGPFTGLPCVGAEPGCGDENAGGCAALCEVEVPEAMRLTSGRFAARLRTPDPVIDGVGRSETAWLSIVPHRPLIDRVDPQGAYATDGVAVRISGHDLTDNVQFSLAGRPPERIDLSRDPTDPRAVTADLVFDLAGVPASVFEDQRLVVTNPGGDRVEVPFGVVPEVYPCPPRGQCRVPVRRTMPPGPPGHVSVHATLPDDGRAWSVLLDGASWWTLLGPPDAEGQRPTLARASAREGGLVLPLPGPQPEGVLRADVPAEAGGTVQLETLRQRPRLVDRQCLIEEHALADGAVDVGLFTDLDGDGEDDAVALHARLARLATVIDGEVTVYELGGLPVALASADLDGDGRADVVVGDARGRVRLLFARADGALSAPLDTPPIEGAGQLSAVAVTDLDGDRLPDVLAGLSATGDTEGGVVRWRGTADGRWTGPTLLAEGGSAAQLAVRDVDQDGRPDVVYCGADGLFEYRSASDETLPVMVAGQPLSGTWCALSDLDRYGIEWLHFGDDDGIAYGVGGRPGPGWSGPVYPVADVGEAFEPLAIADMTRDGRGDLVGAAPVAGGFVVAYVDPSQPDPIQPRPLRHTAIPLSARPVAMTTHVAPGLDDDEDDTPPDLVFSAVLSSGRVVRTSRCPDAVDEENERHNLPGGDRSATRVERVWIDMNHDGWTDEVRLADGQLTVATARDGVPVVADFAAAVGRDTRGGIGADQPDQPDLPDGEEPIGVVPVPPPGECWPSNETTAGIAVLADSLDRQLIFGRGPALVYSPWPPADDCPLRWETTGVGGPVTAVHALPTVDGPLAVVATDGDVLIGTPEVLDRSLRRCVPRLPGAFAPPPAVRIADFDPATPGDELHITAGERAWLWAPAAPCPVEIEAPDAVRAWQAADMDDDGLADRVALIDLPADAGGVEANIVVHRALEPGVFAAEPVGVPTATLTSNGRDVELALADMNGDGRTDVLVVVGSGRTDRVWGRLALGRGDGALHTAMWIRPTQDAIPGEPIDVAAADLTGDGVLDAVTSIGLTSRGTVMADRMLTTLVVRDDGPHALRDGDVFSMDMPAVWVESVTLMVQLDAPASLLAARLQSPRGDRVDLLPDGPVDARGLHWWRSSGVQPIGGLRGRQPAGAWTLELWPMPGEAPVVAGAELVLGARWGRPNGQDEWDLDRDGIPDANDPCPEVTAWPAHACRCVVQCVDWGQGEDVLAACDDSLLAGDACAE